MQASTWWGQVVLAASVVLSCPAAAADVEADSCERADVQQAIDTASAGAIVLVPA